MYNCAAGGCLWLVIPAVDCCGAVVDESVTDFALGGMVLRPAPLQGWLSPLSASYHQGGATVKTGKNREV
jgi:hypothetical protein